MNMTFFDSFIFFISAFSVIVLVIFSLVFFTILRNRYKNLLLGTYFLLFGGTFFSFSFFYNLNIWLSYSMICLIAFVFYLIRSDKPINDLDWRQGIPLLVGCSGMFIVYVFGDALFHFNEGIVKWLLFFSVLMIYFWYLYRSDFFSLVDGSILSHRQFFHFFFMGIHITLPFLALSIVYFHFYFFLIYLYFVALMTLFLVFDLVVNYFQVLSCDFVDFSSQSYQKTHLAQVDLSSLETTLSYLMNEKKVYKDSLLSLKSLANMLEISAHQLSEYLNNVKKKSFSQYLMIFRVEEAKQLLLKYDWRTTLSIGSECGFNSHSSFGRCFKLITGVSPGLYRSENVK